MKQASLLFLFFVGTLFLSCEKEDLSIQSESITKSEVDFRSDQLPNGNGVQKINDNQTNSALERGVGVSIPFFSEETVVVKTGSWVTLRFGIESSFLEGFCPGELTDEDVEAILSNAIQISINNEIEVEFDGEPIEIAPSFRTEGIIFGYDAEEDVCLYNIPWRYYVNPQSAGDHEFTCRINGVEYIRTITWLPGEEEEGDDE